MAKKELSKYQTDIVGRYYDNLNIIMLQKLGEIVTELYLADAEDKKSRLWQRAYQAMVNLKVKPAIITHIMQKKNVEVLAKNLQDWLGNKK